MNKIEAIEAMKQGHKVTHEWFSSDEYIYMIDGEIYDESNYKMSCIGANNQIITFWTDRTDSSWIEGGWEIFKSWGDIAMEAPAIKEESFAIRNYHREYDYTPSYTVRYPNEKFISKNSHRRTNIRKKR